MPDASIPGPQQTFWLWADHGAPPDTSIADRAGDTVGVIAVRDSSSSADRAYAFMVGNDQHLWMNWFDGALWHLSDQGRPDTTTVASLVGALALYDPNLAGDRPYAFVVGNDQQLWLNWSDGVLWHWSNQGTPPDAGVTVSFGVGAVPVVETPSASPSPYAFVVCSDQGVWANCWSNGAWQWTKLGLPGGNLGASVGVGVVTVMDTPSSAQRPYVFVVSTNHELWLTYWSDPDWVWKGFGPPPDEPPLQWTVKPITIGVMTVSDTPSSPQIPHACVVGSDGHLWDCAWVSNDDPDPTWTDHGLPVGTAIAAGIGAITVMDNAIARQRPYAFVLGNAGDLWSSGWDGSAYQWRDQGTPTGATVGGPGGATALVDDDTLAASRPYVCVLGSDGHLWALTTTTVVPQGAIAQTIATAKADLAAELGISPAAIEVLIRW